MRNEQLFEYLNSAGNDFPKTGRTQVSGELKQAGLLLRRNYLKNLHATQMAEWEASGGDVLIARRHKQSPPAR